MSAETSLDFNDGYLQCLSDLKNHISDTFVRIAIEKEFIIPKTKECNKNIGKILDDMYEEYHKPKP